MWCLAKVPLPKPKKRRIGSKTTAYIFIGYTHNSLAYRFLELETNSVLKNKNVEFFENIFLVKDKIEKHDQYEWVVQ